MIVVGLISNTLIISLRPEPFIALSIMGFGNSGYLPWYGLTHPKAYLTIFVMIALSYNIACAILYD